MLFKSNMQNMQKKETKFAKNTQKETISKFSKQKKIWHVNQWCD